MISSVTNRLIRNGHFSRRVPPDAYPMTMPTHCPSMLSICPNDGQTIVSCGTDCVNRVRTMAPILNRPLLPHRNAYCVSAVNENGMLFVWLKLCSSGAPFYLVHFDFGHVLVPGGHNA